MRRSLAVAVACAAVGCGGGAPASPPPAQLSAQRFDPSVVVPGAVLEVPGDGGLAARVRIDDLVSTPPGSTVIGRTLDAAGSAVGRLESGRLRLIVRRPTLGDLEVLYQQGRPPLVVSAGPQSPIACATRSNQPQPAGNRAGIAGRGGVSAAAATGVVDLLVLYTEAARNAEAGCNPCSASETQEASKRIEDRVRDYIEEFNWRFLACSDATIRVHLVGVQSIRFLESNNVETDLKRWQDRSNPDGDALWKLREGVRADLVTVIQEQTGAFDGAAATVNPQSSYADRAVSIVNRLAFGLRQTLAHELGHAMGGGHEDESDKTGAFPYSHAWLIRDPRVTYATVMAVEQNRDRLSYFSNPRKDLVSGVPLGAADKADNVRTMEELAQFLEKLSDADHSHGAISPTCHPSLSTAATVPALTPRPPR